MAKHFVNLDALIAREDFEAVPAGSKPSPSSLATTMKVTELVPDSITYGVLRKPDFQRETASWEPEKVAELIRSFLEGDLIPSVILWRSTKSGNLFVIDGAHRLSALIAWAHDDYGDKGISAQFFDNNIPDEQKKAAERTRKLVEESVGSYRDLSSALRYPASTPEDRLHLARNLSSFAVNLQWVIGEAEKAESSFFKINQQAAPIDPTELEIIRARRKPNALATRAFIRAGTGHKYWSAFDEKTRGEIERIGKEVYDLIFRPPLGSSIRDADLPVAGRGYSSDSVRMIFELVNFANGLDTGMWRESSDGKRKGGRLHSSVEGVPDDADGQATISFMKSVRRAAQRVAGNSPGSLGLHPAVYFYSATGRFQPAAFLAAIAFVRDLDERNALAPFTATRSLFEEFLVEHKYFMNQLVSAYGSMQRAAFPVYVMYRTIAEAIRLAPDPEEVITALSGRPELKSLKVRTAEDIRHNRNFSRETKNWVALKGILDGASRCGICGARMHLRAASFDHIIRKEDGGTGGVENAQLTHPYCNTGYKESHHSKSRDI